MFNALNSDDQGESSSSPSSTSSDDSSSSSSESQSSSSENQDHVSNIEAAESRAKQIFQSCMNSLSRGENGLAKISLQDLLDSEYMNNDKYLTECAPLKSIRYSSLRNLAEIYSNENDTIKSTQLYLEATKLSPEDSWLWHILGVDYIRSNQVLPARFAFERGLQLDPDSWQCLDKLVAVYYVLSDFVACLDCIKSALLRKPKYDRGLVLMEQIFKDQPFYTKIYHELFIKYDPSIVSENTKENIRAKLRPMIERRRREAKCDEKVTSIEANCALKNISWLGLGQTLLDEYNFMHSKRVSMMNLMNFDSWINAVESEINNKITVHFPSVEDDEIKQCVDSIINQVVEINLDIVNENINNILEANISPGSFGKDNNAKYKRRSYRLLPGFIIDDDYLAAGSKQIPLSDRLYTYLPPSLQSENGQEQHFDEQTADISNNLSFNSTQEIYDTPMLEDDAKEILQLLHCINGKGLPECMQFYMRHMISMVTSHLWSEKLKTLFITIYEIGLRHQQFLMPNNNVCRKEIIESSAWVHLTYGELSLTFPQPEDVSPSVNKASGFCSLFCKTRNGFNCEKKWLEFTCRTFWLLASLIPKENVARLTDILYEGSLALDEYLELSGEQFIVIPNQICAQIISSKSVQARIKFVQQSQAIDLVMNKFREEDFEGVIRLMNQVREGDLKKRKIEDRIELRMAYCKSFYQSGKCELGVKQCNLYIHSMLDKLHLLTSSEVEQVMKSLTEMIELLEKCFNAVQNEIVEDLDSAKNLALTLIRLLLFQFDGNKRAPKSFDTHLFPWIALFLVCKHWERVDLCDEMLIDWYKSMESNSVLLATPSLMYLWLAHEQLGKKGKCTQQEGRLLLLLGEEIMFALRHPLIVQFIPSLCIDHMLNMAEQSFFCLYKYPQKCKRHLEDHKALNIQLTWQRCALLFEFVTPESIPEFDDSGKGHTNSDTAQLLHRINDILPQEMQPTEDSEALLNAFILGELDILKPGAGTNNPIVSEIYHLLADYYLKTQYFQKAVKFYRYDLYVNCGKRSDSWAGLALAQGRAFSELLNELTLRYDMLTARDLQRDAHILNCMFTHSVKGTPKAILYTEMASLIYQFHSYISRTIKKISKQSDVKEKDVELCEKWKMQSLKTAEKSLESALKLSESQLKIHEFDFEDWIQYYLLGKVSEKLKYTPDKVLEHYRNAALFILSEGGKYPDKINYNKPQKLAVEAIEIHYRVHSCILKWIQNDEHTEYLPIMHKYMQLFKGHRVRGYAKMSESQRLILSRKVEPEVVDCVINLVEEIAPTQKLKITIATGCIDALRTIVTRFPSHHKSYVRWAISVLKIDCLINLKPQLMAFIFGPGRSVKIPLGLFQMRKNNNLMEGQYRIPCDDIDRNGSFVMHMKRVVNTALRVNVSTKHLHMINECIFGLIKQPPKDKVFMPESDRLLFVSQFIRLYVNIIKRQCNLTENGSKEHLMILSKLMNIYKKLHEKNSSEEPVKLDSIKKLLCEEYLKMKGQTVNSPVDFVTVINELTAVNQKMNINQHGSPVKNSPTKPSSSVNLFANPLPIQSMHKSMLDALKASIKFSAINAQSQSNSEKASGSGVNIQNNSNTPNNIEEQARIHMDFMMQLANLDQQMNSASTSKPKTIGQKRSLPQLNVINLAAGITKKAKKTISAPRKIGSNLNSRRLDANAKQVCDPAIVSNVVGSANSPIDLSSPFKGKLSTSFKPLFPPKL